MLIALLDLRTTSADRAAALAQLDSERDEIRAMPGNLDFRVTPLATTRRPSLSSTNGPTSRRSRPTSPLLRSPGLASCSARW